MAARSTHTPGPWHIQVGDIVSSKGRAICQWDIYTDEPDARLIAAAPDMLAALKEALHVALVHKLPRFEQRVRAAIAKAEGW